MSSFKLEIDPKTKCRTALLFEIYEELEKAFSFQSGKTGMSRADLARILGKDRSSVSRLLNGKSNMTLESLSDLAWALDHKIDVSLIPNCTISSNFSYHDDGPSSTAEIINFPQEVSRSQANIGVERKWL